jgi:hypothetical protein
MSNFLITTKHPKNNATGELEKELGDLLQPGDDTTNSGQCVRTRVSVQSDYGQRLEGQLELLVRWHPARLQRFLGLVRRRSSTSVCV